MSFEALTAPPQGTIFFDKNKREYQRFENGEWIKIDPPANEKMIEGEEFTDFKQRTEADWVPYCFRNGCMRMSKRPYGFQCPTCLNRIGPDMKSYVGK